MCWKLAGCLPALVPQLEACNHPQSELQLRLTFLKLMRKEDMRTLMTDQETNRQKQMSWLGETTAPRCITCAAGKSALPAALAAVLHAGQRSAVQTAGRCDVAAVVKLSAWWLSCSWLLSALHTAMTQHTAKPALPGLATAEPLFSSADRRPTATVQPV